jgi:hypothetical protein
MMPVMAGIFNTITLAVNTPVQVTPPGGGHYTYYFQNGAGKLYISNTNTPGANATSFLVGPNLTSPPITVNSNNLWIASDTAGPVSLYCAPLSIASVR